MPTTLLEVLFAQQRISLPYTSIDFTNIAQSLYNSYHLHIAHIMAIQDEKKVDIETEHTEHIEPELGAVDKVDDVLSIEEVAASKAAWLISVTVSLGGCVYERKTVGPLRQRADHFRFLFGYDTGYISSVLVTIGTSLGHVLSTSEQELVTSLTSGGALIGAVSQACIGHSGSELMLYRLELDSQPIALDARCLSGPPASSLLSEQSSRQLRTQ